jgi:hypothetical protein
MYVIKYEEKKQKEWHPATKPLKNKKRVTEYDISI